MDETKLHRLACKAKDAMRIVEIPHEKEDLTFPGARTPFIRDKDRILYSKPFRRLAYKTQVFVTSELNAEFDEHCRTRLSHTLEVANIAKRISEQLELNTELVEAIALGHDVGHAPFGHAGERILDDFLNWRISYPESSTRKAKIKGNPYTFYHNQACESYSHSHQGVRLLTSYNNYSMHDNELNLGLRLTFQTLCGILKHTDKYKNGSCFYPEVYRYKDCFVTFNDLINNEKYQSVESTVVAISDEIAQIVHDISDAIKIGIIDFHFLKHGEMKDVIDRALAYNRDTNKSTTRFEDFETLEFDILANQLTTILLGYFEGKTFEAIKGIIDTLNSSVLNSIDQIGNSPYPKEDAKKIRDAKDIAILNSTAIATMDTKGKAILSKILESYIVEPRQLPNDVLCKLEDIYKNERYSLNIKLINKLLSYFDIEEEQKKATLKLLVVDGCVQFKPLRSYSVKEYNLVYPFIIFSNGFRRILVDYISQMTDSYAEYEFNRLTV